MELQDGLTEYNFWNRIKEEYPKASKEFCEWIDEYKKEVNWNNLFNSNSSFKNANGFYLSSPEFHDLPYAMQQGIWIEFAKQKLDESFEQPEYFYSGDLEEEIKLVFKELEQVID